MDEKYLDMIIVHVSFYTMGLDVAVGWGASFLFDDFSFRSPLKERDDVFSQLFSVLC